MRKLALLLGSLLVVASASAKEVVPAPVVVEEAPVQVIEKEVIVYRDKEEGFRPNGNVKLEYRWFGDTEDQDAGTWQKATESSGNNYSRVQLEGSVNMTENQKFYFRVRSLNSLSAKSEDGKGVTDSTQTRLRYFYNHGNLGDSKVNFTSRFYYEDTYDETQKLQYFAAFNFAEYMFNNDYVKTTDFTVAPRYTYKWSNSNDDDYTNSLGIYFHMTQEYPLGFGSEIEIDGFEYNMYGQDKANYKNGKVNDKWDDALTLSVKAIITQDTNLYSADKVSVDWHTEGGYDTYKWNSEDSVGYGKKEDTLLLNGEKKKVVSRYEDSSYEAYLSSDVTVTYQTTNFIKVYALAGAEYRNWAVSNENSATNWRWQPYVAAGFNVAF